MMYVSVILGQLISIDQATARMSTLIRKYGLLLDADPAIYCFSDPADIMADNVLMDEAFVRVMPICSTAAFRISDK